jgi:hypothetical protein
MGFVVDKVAVGHFGLPCQFSFHRLLHTHVPCGAGKIGQIVADVTSEFSLTPPHKIKKNDMVSNGRIIDELERIGKDMWLPNRDTISAFASRKLGET